MSYADWLAEQSEVEARWLAHVLTLDKLAQVSISTTAQPQGVVNVANHFRNATEMIGKDDHIAKTGNMVGNEDQTTAFFAGMEERG